MRRDLQAAAIQILLVVVCGCAQSVRTPTETERRPAFPSPRQEALLDKLWLELRSVRDAARSSTPYRTRDPLPDVSLLVGMS